MTTGIERVYKKTRDGKFREFYRQWIYFLNPDGSRHSTKLDKEWAGLLWRKQEVRDHGVNGSIEYTDPDDGITYRLIAIPG